MHLKESNVDGPKISICISMSIIAYANFRKCKAVNLNSRKYLTFTCLLAVSPHFSIRHVCTLSLNKLYR